MANDLEHFSYAYLLPYLLLGEMMAHVFCIFSYLIFLLVSFESSNILDTRPLTDVVYKYLLSVTCPLILSIKGSFTVLKVLILLASNLSIFFFRYSAFPPPIYLFIYFGLLISHPRDLYLAQGLKDLLICFLLKVLIVLCLIFKPTIHFELFSVKDVSFQLRFILLPYGCATVLAPLAEKTNVKALKEYSPCSITYTLVHHLTTGIHCEKC